jgi:AraC family transcriptional activator of pobA
MPIRSSEIDDLPITLFADADRINADIGSSEWRLTSRQEQGRSYALILSKGRGVARLAQGQAALNAPCLVWLPPGVGQALHIAPGSQGYVLSFAENLIAGAVKGHREANELRSIADRLIHAEGSRFGAQIEALSHAATAIHGELRRLEEGGLNMIIAHLTIILVHASRLGGFHTPRMEANRSGSVIFQRFLHAVQLHFRENWTIARYAAQQGVTERRLHFAVTKAAGKSPLQLLHLRILDEAQARLEQSSLPIAQIGYGLGFREPAHFSRFFKKATGVSPGSYRRQRHQEAHRDTTFAAWP